MLSLEKCAVIDRAYIFNVDMNHTFVNRTYI